MMARNSDGARRRVGRDIWKLGRDPVPQIFWTIIRPTRKLSSQGRCYFYQCCHGFDAFEKLDHCRILNHFIMCQLAQRRGAFNLAAGPEVSLAVNVSYSDIQGAGQVTSSKFLSSLSIQTLKKKDNLESRGFIHVTRMSATCDTPA